MPLSDKAKEAARLFCTQLGLLDVKVAAAEPAADNYTFFVVYARADVSLDYASIDVPEIVFKKLGLRRAEQADRGPGRAAGWWCSAPAPGPTPTPWASTPS